MPIPESAKMGYAYDWQEVERFVSSLRRPVFGVAAAPLRDTGKGKTVLLHKHLEKVAGQFRVHHQTIGDCVSHGWGLAVDILKAVEISLHGERERWAAETATEPIYAFSRVEVGGGRLGNGDGSIGAWAARAVAEYGTLLRQKYGRNDLRRYSGNRARTWGRRGAGVPDELEPTSRQHPVRTVSLVTSYEDARDAIANGYPVPVCSNQGFRDRRDSQGFAKASGSWAHCMCFVAVDDQKERPGLLCVNSWGPHWINGPKRHGQPDGSFWVDADTVDRMLRRDPDSYSVSGFEGYPDNSDKLTNSDFLNVWR
jgi:hypothetical protein